MQRPTEREFETCEHCGETILRLPEGMWEHLFNPRLDWDHAPEPEPEMMSEADAEAELERGIRSLQHAFDATRWDPTAAGYVRDVQLRFGKDLL